MAQITIGKIEYDLPEMNFLAIERAWPFIQEATAALDPMQAVSASLAVFAAAIMEGEDFDKTRFNIPKEVVSDFSIHNEVTRFFKKKLMGNELDRVKTTMFDLLKEGGLEITEGEILQSLADAQAEIVEEEAMALLSQETALDTSPSSSRQDAKAEAGTS